MSTSTKNLQYLKGSNQVAIFKRLATLGTTTRAELAREMGLSKMAISNQVSEMIQTGLIKESNVFSNNGNQNSTISRKSIGLDIPDYCLNAIGVLIERYSIRCNAMDIKGQEFYKDCMELPPNSNNQDLLNILIPMIDRLLSTFPNRVFSGIGISSIGPIDIESGTILNPTNFYQIFNLPLKKILAQEYSLPVYMLNCMSASALAEHLYGNAQNCKNMVYVGFGTGVGSGAIINSKVFVGAHGFGGELGHISINPVDGKPCSCGQRGCLETYTSTQVVLKETGYHSVKDLVLDIKNNNISSKTEEVLAIFYDSVLSALIAAANIYDPEMIIIGDLGSLIVEPVLTRLHSKLNCLMIQHGTRVLELSIAAFRENAPLAGAPCIVFDRIFARDLPPFNF